MKISHLHIGFKNLSAAIAWFQQIFGMVPVEQYEGMAVFRFGDVDIAMHEGSEDVLMTLALKALDCKQSYQDAVAKGAIARTPPRDKGGTIGADICGPGRLVIEFEQLILG